MKNLEFMYFELPLQSQAIHYGSLAQLVQSVCLTSRGSGVRIPQLPQEKETRHFTQVPRFYLPIYHEANFQIVAFSFRVLESLRSQDRPVAVSDM